MSKRQLRRTEQNLEKHFLSQMFFRNFFRYWAEELGNFAENYIRVVKTTFNWSGGTLSQQHFWSKSVNISPFPDLYWSFRDNSEKLLSGLKKLQKCLEEKNKEKHNSKEKKLLFYFSHCFERSFPLTLAKNFPAWLSKLQPAYFSKILRFNKFWKIAQCFNLLLSLR